MLLDKCTFISLIKKLSIKKRTQLIFRKVTKYVPKKRHNNVFFSGSVKLMQIDKVI